MADKTTTARIEGAKALIRAQFDDLWGGQNLSPERVAEFYSPTYKGYDPILGETNGLMRYTRPLRQSARHSPIRRWISSTSGAPSTESG